MPNPRYTKKPQVAAVIEPIFDFARDLGGSFESFLTKSTSSKGVVVQVIDGKILPGKKPRRDNPEISQHRKLILHEALEAEHCDILEPLAQLLSHVAPLAPSEINLQLDILQGPDFSLQLSRDGVVIYAGQTLSSFVHAIYVFLRTHENLDMNPRLRPHRITQDRYYCPMRDVTIFADCADHALLRFAACNSEIQSLLRSGAALKCFEVEKMSHDVRNQMINGRVRDMPAAPKDWELA